MVGGLEALVWPCLLLPLHPARMVLSPYCSLSPGAPDNRKPAPQPLPPHSTAPPPPIKGAWALMQEGSGLGASPSGFSRGVRYL